MNAQASTPRRPGSRRLGRWIGLLAVTLIAGGAWFVLGRERLEATQMPLLAEVIEGPFIHEVVERGDISSSSNVEVRSEVRSRSQLGIAILEIVPEGTRVQPGDFLVKLDDSNLQIEQIQQQIVVKNSEAMVIQAETALETAELALQEFESGTYKQSVEENQALVLVAQENVRRAEEYLRYSERLSTKGYVTNIQLDADRFAVEKARKDLDVAQTRLDVLTNFTREKTVKRLEADIQAAEAKLRATRESHQIELDQLAKVQQQIEKCRIVAPVAGQVVYANESGRYSEPLIEEGRLVRERQTIVRLPDPAQMQVIAKVNESRIDLVQPGQTVAVRIDALPGVVLTGVVRKVAEYPLPTSSYTAHVKNYQTDIEIHDPSADLRPGMTAEVVILVEQRDRALQIPVQSLVERSGRHFCLLADATDHLEAREVQIGPTNEKYVVIEKGLTTTDRVVVTPKAHLDLVQLPEETDTLAPRLAAHRQAQQSARESNASKSAEPHVVRKPVVELGRAEQLVTPRAGVGGE